MQADAYCIRAPAQCLAPTVPAPVAAAPRAVAPRPAWRTTGGALQIACSGDVDGLRS